MTASPLITEKDAALILGVSTAWLRKQRLFQKPPVFYKLSGAVRYAPNDLATYIQTARVEPATTTTRRALRGC